MSQFFTGDYAGPAFKFLGAAHLTALTLVVLLNLFLSGLGLPVGLH